jgi:hypothetical protein
MDDDAWIRYLIGLDFEERTKAVERFEQQEQQDTDMRAAEIRSSYRHGVVCISGVPTAGTNRFDLILPQKEIDKRAAQVWCLDLVLTIPLSLEEIEALLIGCFPELFPEARIKELVAER